MRLTLAAEHSRASSSLARGTGTRAADKIRWVSSKRVNLSMAIRRSDRLRGEDRSARVYPSLSPKDARPANCTGSAPPLQSRLPATRGWSPTPFHPRTGKVDDAARNWPGIINIMSLYRVQDKQITAPWKCAPVRGGRRNRRTRQQRGQVPPSRRCLDVRASSLYPDKTRPAQGRPVGLGCFRRVPARRAYLPVRAPFCFSSLARRVSGSLAASISACHSAPGL